MSTILTWAQRSNAAAVTNAQAATVAISRERVQRGEVERYVARCLAERRATPGVTPEVTAAG